jgi:hypothetical protein
MRAMTEESAAEGGGGSAAAAAVATTTSDKLSAEEEEEDQAHVSEIFRVSSLLFSVSPITQHKEISRKIFFFLVGILQQIEKGRKLLTSSDSSSTFILIFRVSCFRVSLSLSAIWTFAIN